MLTQAALHGKDYHFWTRINFFWLANKDLATPYNLFDMNHIRKTKCSNFNLRTIKVKWLIKASGIKATLLTPQESSTIRKGYWAPLLSIPRHLKITPNHPIITEPYLRSTDKLNKAWKDKLTKHKRPIIGVNWKGTEETAKKRIAIFQSNLFFKQLIGLMGALYLYRERRKIMKIGLPGKAKI